MLCYNCNYVIIEMEESYKHEIVQILVNVVDLNSAQYIVDILDFKARWKKCTSHTLGAWAGACEYGYTDCLRYARENGCPWDEWVCTFAAYNGHCLLYTSPSPRDRS